MTALSRSLERHDGIWWPAGNECGHRRSVLAEVEKVEPIVALCGGRRCAVQAGCNVGVVPAALAKLFERVISFEPAAVTVLAASRNLSGSSVQLFEAALGERIGTVRVAQPNGDAVGPMIYNAGALQTRPGGTVPVLTIDSLDLPECDLVMLDVEGDELLALRGGSVTIGRHRPVIVLEDKGLGRRHGIFRGEAPQWLIDTHDYRAVMQMGRDVVMLPAEHRRVESAV